VSKLRDSLARRSLKMKCPHCGIGIAEVWNESHLGNKAGVSWHLYQFFCPDCHKPIIKLKSSNPSNQLSFDRIYPSAEIREVAPEVPEDISRDFKEASSILTLSPRGSAALSRSLLQRLLRDHAKVKNKQNLNRQIEEFIERKDTPGLLKASVDAIRAVGNFACHPIKSKSTGQIVDVEPGEAEWNLEALEALMENLFVQPIRHKARTEALNKKLADAGKPPLRDREGQSPISTTRGFIEE